MHSRCSYRSMLFLTSIVVLCTAQYANSENDTGLATSWTDVVRVMEEKINRMEKRLRESERQNEGENLKLLQIMTNLLTQNEESRQREREYEEKVEQLTTRNGQMEERVEKMEELQAEVGECRRLLSSLNRYRGGMGGMPEGINIQYEVRNGRTPSLEESIAPVDAQTALNHLLKMMVRRSCYDWKSLGFSVSGYYLIDPDGIGVGEAPFNVFCDMLTGFTFVHHGSEGSMEVNPCSGPGCYTRDIHYNATEAQIRGLFHVSGSCQQYIKLECLSSPLQSDGVIYSWWEDVTGEAHVYWSGDGTDRQQTCACGLSKGCVDPQFLCNCDSRVDDAWVSDSGYLSNKSSLPVYKLYFGSDADSTVEMKYTLGPLRCHGWNYQTHPESCQDLKADGATRNGYYLVGPPEKIKLIFCDMKKPEVDHNQTTSGTLEVFDLSPLNELLNGSQNASYSIGPDQQIMFQAYRNLNKRTPNSFISYSSVTTNMGSGLNERTGIFVAPVKGMYFFHFSAYKSERQDTTIHIIKNRDTVAFAKSHSTVKSSTITAAAIVELDVNDQVGAYLKSGSLYGRGRDRFSSFSGFLISASKTTV